MSCTNELDERVAQGYLHDFLKYHPDYSQMPLVLEMEATGGLLVDYDKLRTAFEEAHRLKPQDTQVLLALGVLKFIQRDFVGARNYFGIAIRENPTDHSLWNKFGAAMSNNLDIKKAIEAYELALDLRPNYVRSIVNIGLAFNNLADFKSAATHFMNALILNPKLDHVWIYLRSAFI